MKVEREKALEHKNRMSRMMEDKENFLSKITDARSFIYEVIQFNIIFVLPNQNFHYLKAF